jgi:hypothetical protein
VDAVADIVPLEEYPDVGPGVPDAAGEELARILAHFAAGR